MASDAQAKLVSAAMKLMLRQGYSATGIDSICVEAGLSKGAFYHCFRGKEEVALAALDTFYRRGLEAFEAIDVSDVPPGDRFPAFVERLADRAESLWKSGCLIGGLATEMALTSEELQREVAGRLDGLAAFVEPLAKSYAAALPIPGVKPVSIAEDLLAFIEGVVVLGRGHRDPGLLGPALKRYAAQLRLAAGKRKPTPKPSLSA